MGYKELQREYDNQEDPLYWEPDYEMECENYHIFKNGDEKLDQDDDGNPIPACPICGSINLEIRED